MPTSGIQREGEEREGRKRVGEESKEKKGGGVEKNIYMERGKERARGHGGGQGRQGVQRGRQEVERERPGVERGGQEVERGRQGVKRG